MATYYLRVSGSDSNNGTSSSTAWRTFGKLLGTTGFSSGDTCYVGAGIYREVVTVNMTSAIAETSIIGDIDGSQTGDAGEIQLTAYLINDETLPSASTLLNLNGKDFLTFKKITFIGGNAAQMVSAGATSTDIKFLNCIFITGNPTSHCINTTIGFGVPANWIIDGCIFYGVGSSQFSIQIILTTGVGEDYDANILINNCFFIGSSILVTSTGSSANEGGNVVITNCSFFQASFSTSTTRVGGAMFTYPIKIFNCTMRLAANGTALSSAEFGAIIENYNYIFAGTARTNIAIGTQTIIAGAISPLFEFGQSFLYNFKPRPFGMPLKNSPLLGHGDSNITNGYDILNNPRPNGINNLLFKGMATSANITSLTDTTQNFGSSGNLNGYTLKIIDGQGMGQTKTIFGNNSTTVSGDGVWLVNPNNTSKYVIFQGNTSSTGPVSGATSTVISGSGCNWGANFWQGHTCLITSGTASGQNYIVSGNSNTILSGYYPMNPAPGVGDAYSLFWGGMLQGIVSTGTTGTLTDNTATWPVAPAYPSGFWSQWRCMIIDGSGAGSNFGISGSNVNTLSGYSSFATVPYSGDRYIIFNNTGVLTGYYGSGLYPKYGTDYIQCAVGCYERNDTAVKETGIVLSGTNSISFFGPGTQDFQFAISGNTTISVYSYYDNYYSGVKPQLIIKNGSGIGIPDTTGTLSTNSGVWGAISLDLTPTSIGVVTARLQSNATGVGGSCFFDSFNII